MIRRLTLSLFIIISLLPVASLATQQAQFKPGRDYKIIPAQQTSTTMADSAGKVRVEEFFNYGCGACYRLEPAMEAWLKEKPKGIVFTRTPVVFHSQWEIYAKTYYILKALKLEKKLTPKIFAAVHDAKLAAQFNNLRDEKSMTKFLADQGIKADVFNDAYHFSPQIDADVKRGMSLMQQYAIYSIPTVVVNGKYKTNLQLAKGDGQQMIRIINYLIEKSQSSTD